MCFVAYSLLALAAVAAFFAVGITEAAVLGGTGFALLVCSILCGVEGAMEARREDRRTV